MQEIAAESRGSTGSGAGTKNCHSAVMAYLEELA
jgi:hypothetical protein